MEVDNFGYNRGVSRVGRFSGGRRRGVAGRVHIPICRYFSCRIVARFFSSSIDYATKIKVRIREFY